MKLGPSGLIAIIAIGFLSGPLAAEAQQAGRVWRIGVLGGSYKVGWTALREGLHEFGYVENQNIAMEWRGEGVDMTQFPNLAVELVRLNVDVIVAVNNPAILAAQRATRTIPIVMVVALDAVGSGFVASLAKPGGNTTGVSAQHADVAGKGVHLLKEAIPNLTRLAILWDPALTGMRHSVETTALAAKAFGAQVQILEARSPGELERAFKEMHTARADGLVVHGSSMLFVNRARLAEQAMKHRLPALCSFRQYVEAGCLMSYWVSFDGQYRRAAYFVDRIVKGTKPANLPVEQPTKFELVINLRTAKALRLTIPQSMLLRADELIP